MLQILLLSLSLFAEPQAQCHLGRSDIGFFSAKGQTHTEAYEKAAEKCWQRLMARHSATGHVDEETGHFLIETCVNLKCQ